MNWYAPKTDTTSNAQWSGVTDAPECRYVAYSVCGGHNHHEGVLVLSRRVGERIEVGDGFSLLPDV